MWIMGGRGGIGWVGGLKGLVQMAAGGVGESLLRYRTSYKPTIHLFRTRMVDSQ